VTHADAPPPSSATSHWQMTGADGADMAPELAHFAAMIGLERAAPSRHSALLLLQLYAGAKSGHLNPAKVVHEISILEGHGGQSMLKPPTRFERRPELRGLWHKHYLEDGIPSMALNLQRGMKRHGLPLLQRMVDDAAAAGEERYITAQDVAAIADDAVRGTWERLQEQQALTGEWIVYAVHAGTNYYLSLGSHKEGDGVLRRQIEMFCRREFPFIADQLEPFEE
jgi:hypothetical protein